ncbi:hypothetical protein ACTXT7_008638 [Hymenolepis weldensis]
MNVSHISLSESRRDDRHPFSSSYSLSFYDHWFLQIGDAVSIHPSAKRKLLVPTPKLVTSVLKTPANTTM